jgi:ADP-heptose:LPS heptosyltransferase
MPEELAAAPIVARASPPPRDPGSWRILVLKLDHLGDFIIGRPALQSLRKLFPKAHIRLICGSWNVLAAQASSLVDEVRSYDFFPEQAQRWDGRPVEDIAVFDAAAVGRFDLAIDLRVDGDTRGFLKRVDADLRCGIGSRQAFSFLDIGLPAQAKLPNDPVFAGETQAVIPAARFRSRMRRQRAFVHETAFRHARGHMIFGPYLELPHGDFRATFGLRASGLYWLGRPQVTVEVARNETTIQSARVPLAVLADRSSDGLALNFENREDPDDIRIAKFEFRVSVWGRPWGGALRFSGVQLERIGARAIARFAPADLHVGEQLSLLVDLIGQRVLPMPATPSPVDTTASAEVLAALGVSDRPTIMIAPFSNSSLRDWPIRSFERLIALLLQQTDARIVLLGAPSQAEQLGKIASDCDDPDRVLNLGGRTDWADMPAVLGTASLVICNNSGIAHLAASQGAPTLAIYSASHPPTEWGPRGPRVETLMAEVACSPCGYDRLEDCPHDHLCMTLITPEVVLARVKAMIEPAS